MDFKKLDERYHETRQYKDRWLALYKDLYYYVIPDRDAFNVKFNYRDDGKPTTLQVWDNTAVLAAYQRANDLHGLLLPKDRRWGAWSFDKQFFPQDFIEHSKDLMDEINANIFSYLNQSNLARTVASSNLDLSGGTSAMWVESIDDNEPLVFRSVPAVSLYIEYSNDDVVNTGWYQTKIRGGRIRELFPSYNGKKLESLIYQPNELYTVVYGQIKDQFGRFYKYAVMEEDPFTPLWEFESDYPQLIITRDRVRPGESDGRGIGMDLLPTIRDLNRMVEYRSKVQAFKAYPPIFVDTGSYFNPYSVRQWAGSIIPRNPQGRQNPVELMKAPDNVEVHEVIKDLRDQVMKGFMVDPLGEIDSPVKSATEISIREKRAQRTSSIDISRLINEQPKQIYEVATKILAERRLLSKDRRVKNLNLKKMKFDFESPLFDIQKQDDLNHLGLNMQMKQQFMGQGTAMMSLNLFEVNRFLTERTNLPAKLFKDDDEFKQALEQVAAQAQQTGMQPTPSTSALKIQAPERPEVTI